MAGCTSKCQPMDVCNNKPFILRKCWVEYVAEMIEEKHDQIPPPSRQHMVDWVEKAYNAISCLWYNKHRQKYGSKWILLQKMHGKCLSTS